MQTHVHSMNKKGEVLMGHHLALQIELAEGFVNGNKKEIPNDSDKESLQKKDKIHTAATPSSLVPQRETTPQQHRI